MMKILKRRIRAAKGLPILLARRVSWPHGHDTFMAWCPFCAKEHEHGAGEGHRVAHCASDNNSPFRESGYYLLEIKEIQSAAAMLGHKGGRVTAIRLTPEQRKANARRAIAIRWKRVKKLKGELNANSR